MFWHVPTLSDKFRQVLTNLDKFGKKRQVLTSSDKFRQVSTEKTSSEKFQQVSTSLDRKDIGRHEKTWKDIDWQILNNQTFSKI